MIEKSFKKIKEAIINKSINRKKLLFMIIMTSIIFFAIVFIFVHLNADAYNKTIAKITSITEKKSTKSGTDGNIEEVKEQQITAIIINGKHKEEEIHLQNTTSSSKSNGLDIKVKDEVFISIQEDSNNKILSAKLLDFKRDDYVLYISIIFILLILIIGGFKGFKSLSSVIINVLIFSILVNMFLLGYNLTIISIVASILFIILSILIVSGINKKALSAIIGTMIGTMVTMLISVIVINVNHWNGIHFDSMEFLPNGQIFISEILIGTLGAIMDIAISISSSLEELCHNNSNIEIKTLINSGLNIGKDIMGTMSNTLVFAYISGSIPMILLLLENNIPISYIVNVNLSLEIIRALTGSIGVVLSIPITIFTFVVLFKNHKDGEVKL